LVFNKHVLHVVNRSMKLVEFLWCVIMNLGYQD